MGGFFVRPRFVHGSRSDASTIAPRTKPIRVDVSSQKKFAVQGRGKIPLSPLGRLPIMAACFRDVSAVSLVAIASQRFIAPGNWRLGRVATAGPVAPHYSLE